MHNLKKVSAIGVGDKLIEESNQTGFSPRAERCDQVASDLITPKYSNTNRRRSAENLASEASLQTYELVGTIRTPDEAHFSTYLPLRLFEFLGQRPSTLHPGSTNS
jgi:hypothetical protein